LAVAGGNLFQGRKGNLRRRLLLAVSASVATLLFSAQGVFAAFTTISNPDAAYLAATGKCDLGTVGTLTSSCTDANGLSATFSAPLSVLQVPGGGWATWSSPPNSESATPKVAFYGGTSLTVDESNVISPIAGVELEPNIFATYTMTVDFYDYQGNLFASVSRSVGGFAGARLFAINSDAEVVAKLVITCGCGGGGWALAQLRATDFTTDPSITAPAGGSAPSGGSSNS
jgi:hypothetical protein